MQTVVVETSIYASPQQCFDAARDLDLHMKSVASTKETAVAGRTSGLIEFGEEVTWRARHFGVMQYFTSKIIVFDPPRYFQDAMQRGAFKSFVHDHYFEACEDGTRMTDVLAFRSPFGVVGAIVDRLVMTRYLTRLLTKRNDTVKAALERDQG